ncbi:MAG: dihydroorotate dehydrogenase electron transfer subunit [Bacteroides sp.]|nr:dihydroorotate dehydrogenase electron transfer subunit [Bacteroides sp.]MCM1380170.1 dihydroorotate dehydrogenase electron transfer subunit [Bacteroides sp.]MCM1446481.1 dihydroorotate dehydrogenase electron transfer subunit [Prevotella sp.]
MKVVADFRVESNAALGNNYGLLTLKADGPIPEVTAGQFAQVRIDGSKTTFLRRPISICSANAAEGTVELLVRRAGAGTDALLRTPVGTAVNLMLPLGSGFTMPQGKDFRLLLAGGGVGVAPMYALGLQLKAAGHAPEFLLGARSAADLLLLDRFKALGTVHITTDDGSAGTRGVATAHPRWQQPVDRVYCCGPKPMMMAVARAAQKLGADCEVSLENMMACGLGACLCCVEKTVKGNVCVCTEGPVFNINQLTWLD